MDNLGETGVVLKRLAVGDWATIVEDINHNFAQLLSTPLFKGTKGDPGNSGAAGTDGERGIKWFYVNVLKWQAQFPEITTGAQITQNFVNTKLVSDPAKVLAALEIDRLINKDVLVLPNQLILSYNSSTALFEPTGASFASNSVTTGQVQSMIDSALANLNIGAKLLRLYDATAKNYPDGGTGGQNNAQNPDSILDISTSDSGPGYGLGQTVKFFGMDETTLPTESDWSTIFGTSPKKYHALVQSTQNTVGQTTNEYGPGPTDPATLVLMQASRNNGLILGWKGESTLRNFSRIYRRQSGLVLTSNYSAYQNEFGEVIIEQTKIDLRAPSTNVRQNFFVFGTAQFEAAVTAKSTVTLTTLPSADILATDNTGKIIRGLGVETVSLSGSATLIPNSTVVKNEIIRLEQLIQSLSGSTGADLTAVLARLTDLELRALRFLDGYWNNFNTKVDRGIWMTNNDETGTALPANTYGYLINFNHPYNPNFIFQLFVSSGRVAFRTGVYSGSAWTFGAWTRLATQAQIDALTTSISTLQTQVNGIQAATLAAIGVDDNWIGKTGSVTINHISKSLPSSNVSTSTYETRTPGSVLADVTTDSNHVTGKSLWQIDRGLLPQAGFIQYFFLPAMSPINQTWTTLYNKFFFANGRGRLVPPEFNSTIGGLTPTIDLRHYCIADGRNGSPDVSGIVLAGAGPWRQYGVRGTGATYYLGQPKTFDEGTAYFKPGSVHGQYAVLLDSSQGPYHNHTYTDTVLLEAGKFNPPAQSSILKQYNWSNWGWGSGGGVDGDNIRFYVNGATGYSGSGSGAEHETRQPTMHVFALWYIGPQ